LDNGGKIVRRILAGVALMFFALPVWAQTLSENRARCDSNQPDISIAGCTALIRSGQETNPGNQSVAYYNRGSAYYFKGLLDQSLVDFNKAIALKSDDPNTYLGRGAVYLKKELYDQAIADFTKTIALQPDRANAYNIRGLTYERKSERDKAISDYRAALKLNPNDKGSKEGLERLK
jgi:tetratricopeptide (TPR) repeat protein